MKTYSFEEEAVKFHFVKVPSGFCKKKGKTRFVQGFYISRHLINHGQWWKVDSLPQVQVPLSEKSQVRGLSYTSVDQIYWKDVEEFCQRFGVYSGLECRAPNHIELKYSYSLNLIKSESAQLREWYQVREWCSDVDRKGRRKVFTMYFNNLGPLSSTGPGGYVDPYYKDSNLGFRVCLYPKKFRLNF